MAQVRADGNREYRHQPLLLVQWILLVCMFVFVAVGSSLGDVSYSCVFISIRLSRGSILFLAVLAAVHVRCFSWLL